MKSTEAAKGNSLVVSVVNTAASYGKSVVRVGYVTEDCNRFDHNGNCFVIVGPVAAFKHDVAYGAFGFTFSGIQIAYLDDFVLFDDRFWGVRAVSL